MINDSQLARSILDRGLADEETLERGRALQKKNDQSLYEALSIGKFIDDATLLELASHLLDIPATRLETRSIEKTVLQLVPSSMAFRNRVFPIELRDDALVLGMIDPVDVLAMDEIAMHTGINISPVLVSPEDMNRALDSHYGGHDELHQLDDGILDSISALDVDSMVDDVISDESWVGFFDDSQATADEISNRMKDRPSTGVLEIDSEEIEIADDADLLAGLDMPLGNDASDVELENWDVDDAITNNKPLTDPDDLDNPLSEGPLSLGENSSFILSKDSAEELFKQESRDEKSDAVADPNDQTSIGNAFDRDQSSVSAAALRGSRSEDTFKHEAKTNVGVAQLGEQSYSEFVRREFPNDETPPGGMPTSELVDLDERARDATPISSLAIERSDPQTRELSHDKLSDLAGRFAEHEVSTLEEDTATADEKAERISSLMKGFRKSAETVEGPAAAGPRAQRTRPKDLQPLTETVDLEIPSNISDRVLLETLLKILVAQRTIDKHTLLALLNDEDES